MMCNMMELHMDLKQIGYLYLQTIKEHMYVKF
jgi:hypothetical protein